jgi:hypothetical protein
MKRLAIALPVVVLISLSLVVCREDPSIDTSKYTVAVVDGVRHIHNRAPQLGVASAVKLELIGKIGELEGKTDKDVLYDPVDAVRLPNGDILVLEGKGCDIKRYDKEHKFISSFGQRGQGPGDFSSPLFLRLSVDRNRLYVADNDVYRISRFLIDGSFEHGFMPSKSSTGPGGSIGELFRTSGMAVLSGSRVVLPSPTSWVEDEWTHNLLSVYDETGKTVRSFGVLKQYDDPLLTLNSNIVYFSTDRQDNIYIAYGFQNRVDKYSSDGRMIFSADRYLPYEPKNEMKALLFKSGSVERELPWPSVTSVTRGIYSDPKNRIWALTFLKEPNKFGSFGDEEDLADCYEFHVFDSNGIFLFKVPFPNIRFDNIAIYDDRMYLVDPGQESCVYEFRIVEEN